MYKAKYISGPIRTALIKYPKSETVAIHLRIKAGSNYESKKNVGSAHMLEHLITKSSNIGDLKYGNGKLYGVTSRDNLLFLVVGMKKDWQKFVTLLAKLFKEVDFSDVELNRQKQVITQEITRYKSIPEKYISRVAYKNIFPDSRMALLNSGDIGDVNALTIKKIMEYRNAHFTQDSIAIVAAGDINENDLKKCVKENFSDIKTKSLANSIDLRPNPKLDTQIFSSDHYLITHVKISFIGRTIQHRSKYINELLAYIYNKLLVKELKEKHAYSYRVNCDSFSSGNFGIFSIYYSVDEKKLFNSIRCVKNIVRHTTITEQMVNIAKDELILDKALNNEKPSFAADYFSELLLFAGGKILHDNIISKIKEIGLSEILKEENMIKIQNPKITILTKSFNTDQVKDEIKALWQEK
jgi:predicted Zn-dependent peptidase